MRAGDGWQATQATDASNTYIYDKSLPLEPTTRKVVIIAEGLVQKCYVLAILAVLFVLKSTTDLLN